MPLNIKNDYVSQLANELTKETGESITTAVGKALEDRIGNLRRSTLRRGIAQRLLEIGQNCATVAPKDWLTRDFDAELYDEEGLPR